MTPDRDRELAAEAFAWLGDLVRWLSLTGQAGAELVGMSVTEERYRELVRKGERGLTPGPARRIGPRRRTELSRRRKSTIE